MGTKISKKVKGPNIMGVIVKASPVEVSTPYFSQNSAPTPLLEAAAILTGTDRYVRKDDKTTVEYKIDLDENIFSPVETTMKNTKSLLAMCHLAFAEHRPMALTPDLLWHYIVKGISIHIHK